MGFGERFKNAKDSVILSGVVSIAAAQGLTSEARADDLQVVGHDANSITLKMPTATNTYNLQAASALVNPVWLSVSNNLSPGQIVTLPINHSANFYRTVSLEVGSAVEKVEAKDALKPKVKGR